EVREIRFAQEHGVEQVLHTGALETLKLRPLIERKLELVAIPDLENEDLVMRVAEVRESFEQRCDIAETIRKNDQESASMEFWNEIVEDGAELRLAAGLGALQLVDQDAQMTHTRTRRDVFSNLRVEGDHADAVLLADHQVREARGEARGVFIFRDA